MLFSSILPFSFSVVSGHSMQPFLNEGDRVVVFRWAYIFSQPKKGDVIVFHGSGGKAYLKRITAVAAENEFIVEGDNKEDSKKVPPITRKSIIGKVIFSYS